MSVSPAIPSRLYHYTCGSHGRTGIEATQVVRPWPQPLLRTSLCWFTDLELPIRYALGLTSHTLCCNRTEFRVSVDTKGTPIMPWWHWCHNTVDPVIRDIYEDTGMPMHWWVSEQPIKAGEIVDTQTLYLPAKAT
jgi:hypothetical protein